MPRHYPKLHPQNIKLAVAHLRHKWERTITPVALGLLLVASILFLARRWTTPPQDTTPSATTPAPVPTGVPSPAQSPTPPRRAPRPDEVEMLARLCTVEVRGMGEHRAIACLSVVSTVLTRAQASILSDGTIRGTIVWNCRPDSEWCQFPAYVVTGCTGIVPQSCPDSYPGSLGYFQGLLEHWVASGMPETAGGCYGYLFYGIQTFDEPTCQIAAPNGQFTNWHNGLHDNETQEDGQ